ncbi:peptidase M23 [Bacteroidia bacterium]|nr:peptidase M23 [Bacteroidia bacterium]
MNKRVKKKAFWSKLRFKYKLLFLNENSLEEVFSFRLSWLFGLLTVVFFAGILITATAAIIIKTPIRNYLPGYLNAEIRQEMVDNVLKIDSLEHKMVVLSKYLSNVGAIMTGEMQLDEVPKMDSVLDKSNVILEKSEKEADFVHNFEEEEKYNLNVLATSVISDNAVFYKPVKGMVSSAFNAREKHYGIDIAATPKESVLATMKGTIVYTGFDPNFGHVIQIQHSNGFISIYKHNALLLKKQGDEIKSGEAIALIGNTGSFSTGFHLHFELWYKGKPVDPCEYINFN